VNGGAGGRPHAVLLDIEGTTTPIAFVYDVLFPFARARVSSFLRANAGRPSMRSLVDTLRADFAAPPLGHSAADSLDDIEATGLDRLAGHIVEAIDRDRKTTSLKALQGLIWEEGYRAGELHGEVFDDVPGALERWSRAGIDVRIYSSGSTLGQRWLFATVPSGDLTRYLNGYFDTGIGAKIDSASYRRIVAALDCPPGDVVFISDVVAELDAARAAGLVARLAVRPGNPPQPSREDLQAVRDFEELGF
jgi:enolase-phosphatase E1